MLRDRFVIAIAILLYRSVAHGEIQIPYNVTEPGNVSLAVYDGDGIMVRTLMNAERHEAGKHVVEWDGLDFKGGPVNPDTYTCKMLVSKGLISEYLMSLGVSSSYSPWPGQHGGPYGVSMQGDIITMVAGSVEGTPQAVRFKRNGEIVRYVDPHLQMIGATGSCVDGNRLYMMHAKTGQLVYEDLDTGKNRKTVQTKVLFKRFDFGTADSPLEEDAIKVVPVVYTGERGFGWQNAEGITAARRDGTDRLRADFHEFKGDNSPRSFVVDVPRGHWGVQVILGDPQQATGPVRVGQSSKNTSIGQYSEPLDAGSFKSIGLRHAGPWGIDAPASLEVEKGQVRIGFALASENEIDRICIAAIEIYAFPEKIDARVGDFIATMGGAGLAWIAPETGNVVDQSKPMQVHDAAVAERGKAAVVTDSALVMVTCENAEPTVLAEGLDEPTAVCVDHTNGDILVAETGESHQVKRFSADGRLLEAYGRKGGRKTGLYNPQDFRGLRDIAADSDGGFVIAENDAAPRRTAIFDSDGKLVREWYGGQRFYNVACPDPENPNSVWCDSQWGWVMEVEVDYEKKTWRPHATYRWTGGIADNLIDFGKHFQRHYLIRRDLDGDGKIERYLWMQGSTMLVRVDEREGVLRPVAYIGRVSPEAVGTTNDIPQGVPDAWLNAIKAAGGDPNDRASRDWHRRIAWADRNNDGKVDEGELQIAPGNQWVQGALHIDESMHIWSAGQHIKGRMPAWQEYTPLDSKQPGVLVWSWDCIAQGTDSELSSVADLFRDPRRNIYAAGFTAGDGFTATSTFDKLSHGYGWPANLRAGVAVMKFDQQGKQIWRVSSQAGDLNQLNGQLHYPSHIAGLAKNCIGITDKIVKPCEFWTTDGLYVGGVLDQRANDEFPPAVYSWWVREANPQRYSGYENMGIHQYDMIVGGTLAELNNGDVLWYGAGWNYTPVFRIRGFDTIKRCEFRISVDEFSKKAAEAGNGLKAEYYDNISLSGKPLLIRTDPGIWRDSRTKNDWGMKKPWPETVAGKDFSVRWSGQLEPRFSEEYRFRIYTRTREVDRKTLTPKIRIRFDGETLLDTWGKDVNMGHVGGGVHKLCTKPAKLQAGRKYDLSVEYSAADVKSPELHVNWESMTQELEHVPSECLYSEMLREVHVPGVDSNRKRLQF